MRLGSVLYVYKGEWGLPSVDLECLRALCLVKFTKCPLQIVTDSNPLRSGAGKLPYLHIGDEKFIGYKQIKKFLDKEGYPIDGHISNFKAKCLSSAYVNWVFTNLHLYYNYFLYGDPNNPDTTRALYSKRTPFPFNLYYPGTYHKEAHDVVLVMAGFDFNDKIEKHECEYIISNAKMCINILSKKLDQNVWFLGDFFSEFDAIVYAYVSILYKISLPNNPLQNHIKGCQNLVNFVNRISRDIFKNEAFNSSNKQTDNRGTTEELTSHDHSFFHSERRTKFLAAIGATVAMTTFAAWKGLYNQFANFTHYDDYYAEDEHIEDLE